MPDIKEHPSLEILMELTDRLSERDSSYAKKNYQLSVLIEIQKLLLQNNDKKLFEKIISMLSAIVTASRIYIYKNVDQEHATLLHEFHDSEFLSYTTLKDPLEYEHFPVFNLYLQSHQIFHFLVSDIPIPEKTSFEKLSIKVTLRVPLYVKNKLWGFIGFDNCKTSSIWSQGDTDVLKNAAVSIELYLKTKQIEKELFTSDSLLVYLWNNTDSIMLLLDDKNIVSRVNLPFIIASDLKAEEVIGKNIKDIYENVGGDVVRLISNKTLEILSSDVIDVENKKFVLVIFKPN